ncbi:MAG: AAA family ATPase, partial [Candidatus Altiarchaeales archaeon]|nr:AAA family ATPase [Candidatus Altiarchaeales archaeon]MBD3416788.1 AAA family ATPase [Candidatus Altiarchaeales archaeon]
MRINRIETKAYLISREGEDAALARFKARARELERQHGSKVKINVEHKYAPLVILYAIKRDMDGKGTLVHGMENHFHIGLKDACIYVFGSKGVGDMAKSTFVKPHEAEIERIDLLLDVATLSPLALQTLGYLVDHGTVNFLQLDVPKQNGAKELQGRKWADIYRPEDRESDFKSVLKDIFEMQRVTPLYKVKATLPTPRFVKSSYDLSARLQMSDVVEDEVELEKIAHAPEKLMYILGTMFNCSLGVERIVYLPYIECFYQWEGKQTSEIRYIPCLTGMQPKKYVAPKKLKTVMLGTKGHGLNAIPIEDVVINFSNVAGMEEVKEKIKEAIIYPIAHPELSKDFGTKGGGGVLFYGPPGCGKTYIMRATVGEAGVNFFSASVQDIIGDDPEAGAKKLDDSFNEARAGSPAILFFDEIDALAGSRKSSKTGADRRLVNQFLTNMEGVGTTNENVLIVGSTNAPWDMDPALRRAGRFTTQIFIPPPDAEARMVLFKIHTKGRPLDDSVDFERLVELTENYSSSDITAICDEAAKIPWSESVHGAEKRAISMMDFMSILNSRESTLVPWLRLAEKQMRESGESELFPELSDYVFKRAGGIEMVQSPDLKFENVGGLTEVKEEIKNKIVYPLKHPELSNEYGRTLGGGLMLYGPPGCGKTYIARATAGECEASFFNVKMTDLLSPEEGVTEKRLHSIFERASRNVPAVIFFDEVDAVAGQRSSSQGGAERRLINQFLTEMDGFERREGVVVLAAT